MTPEHEMDPRIVALRKEYADIGDVGRYVEQLERDVVGLRETLIVVQAGYQALERAYTRLSETRMGEDEGRYTEYES